jgi:hypothetical protein
MRSSKQVTFCPLTHFNELLCDVRCVFLCCRRSSLEATFEVLLQLLQTTLRLDKSHSSNPLRDRYSLGKRRCRIIVSVNTTSLTCIVDLYFELRGVPARANSGQTGCLTGVCRLNGGFLCGSSIAHLHWLQLSVQLVREVSELGELFASFSCQGTLA